jgi:nucleoside phosphorylase
MIKILLVEDEQEKRRLLVEAALEVSGLTISDIHCLADAFSAKQAIKSKKYDLLILDINIPARADCRSETGGGLDILRYIRNNPKAIAPTYIVGMSAYDDGLEAAESDFASPLWKLIKFSHSDLWWKEPLKQAITYLISQNGPPYPNDGHTYHSDLGIIVALEDEELESIKNLEANWQNIEVPYDNSRYLKGTFANEDVELDVIAVAAPKMGMPPSAVIATKLISTFRPRYLAMTGICAGVRGKTNIGDILVADPCFDCGSGKWVKQSGEQGLKFRPAPYPWRLDEELRAGVRRVAESTGLINSIYASFHGNKPDSVPKVIVEAMASGGSVLQATQLMNDIQEQHKNLIGVEMESYAVFTAAEYSTTPRPTCISIKSVCDFGDDEKSDHFHKYAAHTSAQFLFHFALSELAESD